jgi:hypothetical protein
LRQDARGQQPLRPVFFKAIVPECIPSCQFQLHVKNSGAQACGLKTQASAEKTLETRQHKLFGV